MWLQRVQGILIFTIFLANHTSFYLFMNDYRGIYLFFQLKENDFLFTTKGSMSMRVARRLCKNFRQKQHGKITIFSTLR